MSELLMPCPFCQSDAELDTQQGFRRMSDGVIRTGVAVYCTKCSAQIHFCYDDIPDLTPEFVIKLWNTRAQPIAPAPGVGEAGHAGDCTIYRALINNSPTDGICTCGYGWSLVRNSDWSQMYSKELMEREVGRTDAERMDWLAKSDPKGGTNFVTNNQLGWEPQRIFGVSLFPYFKHGEGWFPSLREAIDAAMNESEANRE